MKFLINILFLLCCHFLNAQTYYLDEEFDAGTSAPGSWTFTSIGGTSTSSSYYGRSSPSLVMDATNDRIQTAAWIGTGDQVTFWMRAASGASTPTTDVMQVEGWNGSAWTTVGTARPTTTSRIYAMTLASNITQLRFTYTRTVANINLDDVKVRIAGLCSQSLVLSGIMVDACGSDEGFSEYVSGINTGPAMNVADLELNFPDAGTSGGCTYCGTAANAPCEDFFVTSGATATYISSLNSTAGCGTLFQTPPGGVIPAGGRFMIFAGAPPTFTFNFSALCTSGPYYAIFCNNTADNNGRFGNQSSCSGQACPRDVLIRNNATGCLDTNWYDRSMTSSSNGAYVYFGGTSGNNAQYLTSSTCTNFAPLPVELVSFTGFSLDQGIQLNWSTASETNNDYFEIERATETGEFISVGRVEGIGTTAMYSYYTFTDNSAGSGTTYYRLKQTDINGDFEYSPMISVDHALSTQEFSVHTWNCAGGICYSLSGWEGPVQVQLFNATGQLIFSGVSLAEESQNIPIYSNEAGVYFLRATSGEHQRVQTLIR